MKPKNINPNISESSQSTASSSGTSSQTKGKGKEVINVVESLDIVIKNTKQLSSESKDNLNTIIDNNQLFWMKPDERKELAEKFSGLDSILYDKLEKKVGKIQPTTESNISEGVVLGLGGLFPVFGTAVLVPGYMRDIDKLKQKLEHSFSVNEVKAIVVEQQKQINHKLIAIRDIMLEENTEKDTEISNLKQSLQETSTKAQTEIKKARELGEKQLEAERAINTKLQQQKKLLKNESQAELTAINEKYRQLENTAQTNEDKIQLLEQKIAEYAALINQKDCEQEIIMLEWQKLLTQYNQLAEEQKALNIEKAALEVNLNTEKRNHEATKTNKDLKITHLENYLENETKKNQEKDRLLEEKRLAFLAVCQEREDLKNASAPKWLRKTAYWVDWALDTQCETNLNLTWRKGRSWIGMLFLILIASVLLYLFSWVIRILVAVGRNVKAIFTKKQDTATVLKELVSGMKEAKKSLIEKKPKKPQELEIQPIDENTEDPKNFSPVNPDEPELEEENFPTPLKKNSKKIKVGKKKPKNKK